MYSTLIFLSLFAICRCEQVDEEMYKIEGKVFKPESADFNWFANTRVFTNTGLTAFLREDGQFVMHNVPWGSHIVYVMHPSYAYQPARVDVSSKGKQRARVVNLIQPSKVDLVPYPLKFKSAGSFKYFQQREQLRVTDFLMNPMVLMTLVPLLLMMVLPRLNDPEARKDMDQIQMPKVDTPDISEILTNMLGGAPQQKQRVKPGKRKEN